MAESRALAVSIGFALAGIVSLGLLAGYTFGSNEVALEPPEPKIEAESEPVQPDVSRPVRNSAQRPEPRPADEPASEPRVFNESITTGSKTPLVPPTAPAPQETRLTPPAAAGSAFEPESVASAEIDTSGAFVPFAVAGDIRSIDFYNGFTFPLAAVGPIAVINGEAPTSPAGQPLDFVVDAVVYGDATGDGNDDAAVAFHYTDKWGDTLSLVRLFSIQDGNLEDWGSTWADYYSRAEIAHVSIGHGMITVDSTDRAVGVASKLIWATQGSDVGLQRIEVRAERVYVDLTEQGGDEPVEVGARQGAVRAVVVAAANERSTFAFEADAGWTVDASSSQATDARLRIWEHPTGRLVGDARPGQPLQLAGAGRYVAQVVNEEPVTIELEATDQRTLLAPTWTPRSRVAVTEDPARREVRAMWPEFLTAAGAADLDAVNKTIRDFVNDRVQQHQQAVDGTCDVDERSMFSLTYRLTLVSYDLVSIEFNEFICLCESGDTNDRHLLTIDLNTGRVIEADQLFVGPSADLTSVWWDVAQQHDTYLATEDFQAREPQLANLRAVSLHSYGVTVEAEFTTNDDHGAYARTVLNFDTLGDLVDPAIATRAKTGAAAALPIEEGCGC